MILNLKDATATDASNGAANGADTEGETAEMIDTNGAAVGGGEEAGGEDKGGSAESPVVSVDTGPHGGIVESKTDASTEGTGNGKASAEGNP